MKSWLKSNRFNQSKIESNINSKKNKQKKAEIWWIGGQKKSWLKVGLKYGKIAKFLENSNKKKKY